MSLSQQEFIDLFNDKLTTTLGIRVEEATNKEAYQTVSLLLKDIILRKWQLTQTNQLETDEKQMYYFSMEFLLGRLIESNLLNMGLLEVCENALKELGFEPAQVFTEEHDAGLGNGGLGRLAACFLDSLASLNLPGHGVGIRYKYGLFQQKMVDGYQVELPDYWLNDDYMWETKRSEKAVEVHFGGHVTLEKKDNQYTVHHQNYERVLAVPYDVPIVGYETDAVNTLRLWSAESMPNSFHFHSPKGHDYYHYLDYKRSVEQISEFLYPDDSYYEGKLLRLKQQYFLVSAGLQSILKRFKSKHQSFQLLPQKVSLQINDTHPSLIIPELMRILMDEEKFGWDDAWEITTSTVAYTNHTTLVEALEKWPTEMVKSLLPRIYMIIEEINERFCQSIYFDFPHLREKIADMAIISYEQIHMAHLAIVGSYSVNGVAKLHTDILKNREMKNFYTVFPERFNNKTNGITHRRWLLNVNRDLANKITGAIGENWIQEPRELIQLIKYADDASFQKQIAEVKHTNKEKLAAYIKEHYQITINPNSIFDVHIKRLHGYKRQLLNLFHILHLYQLCVDNPNYQMVPRTFIFGAKAAPGYHFAKQVIKLITATAEKVNNNPATKDKMKVVFLENYKVSLAEKIIPAADLSEQISTASKEASGTGNMKLMMNGALTIGTLDGANIEISDMVGPKNIFTFGLTSDQVFDYQKNGQYRARDIYNSDKRLREVMDKLLGTFFSPDDVEFKNIYYSLLYNNDEYFVLRDFDSYVEAQQHVEQTYRNQQSWLKKSITNMAHSGKFSSDRTISEYANQIWDIHPQ
ncbi:glycogen/starch/alpha-glucan phosphorylase [Alkalihalobacillus pseudalcaliphilus]|uniref:glycogen/starch/alpha-glucan phosphorylase n=1 Tax=Alkalihalobacillus pseudalcaliphilus TaxID=79884 RepID=UPI00064DB827|nr:glycogen/starch/alpha-glucan phosphorylase [Alkalihalobacillus pseudalcaliphilus]KMK75648.1 maltodextrin phosphorylase [Alkalihalobacillus pseudalcaliphilus]